MDDQSILNEPTYEELIERKNMAYKVIISRLDAMTSGLQNLAFEIGMIANNVERIMETDKYIEAYNKEEAKSSEL